MHSKKNLLEISKSVQNLCTQVGIFILFEKDKVSHQDIEIKDLNSLVSYVDKEAEQQLVKGLSEILPEAGFIAEEGTGTQNKNGYNWVIDPLDGTTNFLFGLPIFAISIALVHQEKVQVGVVYELGQKEMFSATLSGGAFLNNQPIVASKRKDFSEALFATGFPYYDFTRMEGFLKLLGYLCTSTRGVRRLGSAATDLAYVACGRFDGFFEYGLSPWDVAAGALIVQEAGGIVSDYHNKSDYIFGKEIAAGSKNLHQPMLDKINKFMPQL